MSKHEQFVRIFLLRLFLLHQIFGKPFDKESCHWNDISSRHSNHFSVPMRNVFVELFVHGKYKLTGQFRLRSYSRLKYQLISSNVEVPVISYVVRYLCMVYLEL